LRKRVFLKSPVRENRTPGSVRGRSGNWPSYRDDIQDHVAASIILVLNLGAWEVSAGIYPLLQLI
jgi:hypothetical protein